MINCKANDEAILLSNIAFSYQPFEKPVLTINDWRVQVAEHVFLHGESGSGKSTLLNLLAGLLAPSSGTINLNGTNITQLNTRQRDHYRAKHIGVVFQQFNLIPYLSVLDNILLAAHFGSTSKQLVVERAHQLLDEVNLSENLLSRQASQLSIGQQQRVAIIRALINAPSLLLVDEPTSALDPQNRDAFIAMLFPLLQQHACTLIFVSHDQALAQHFSQKVELASLNTALDQTK